MSSHNNSFAASGSSPTQSASEIPPDFLVENHSSILLLRPISPAAFISVEQHLPSDRLTFGNAVGIEPRYVSAILLGL
jgi:hypothetical protein